MKHKGHKKFIRILLIYIPVGFVIATVSFVFALKWMPVYFTPLMIVRTFQNFGDDTYNTTKTWKPLAQISPNMAMAVMASEDTRFLDHNGFDWVEIDNAIDANKRGKKLRGASTISQQTAKNVFLFPGRSWVRKGFEVYFTALIEVIWGKERIMEVYLNIAEMGRGVFGAEAAAQKLFQTRAYKLSQRQAALIAATLPNPLKRRANSPTSYINKRASSIQHMMNLIARPQWLNKKVAHK
ncbi:MAG: monofunctional biosynthetic peptidoglycan transglycosylase [Bacteroidales bacterium]